MSGSASFDSASGSASDDETGSALDSASGGETRSFVYGKDCAWDSASVCARDYVCGKGSVFAMVTSDDEMDFVFD